MGEICVVGVQTNPTVGDLHGNTVKVLSILQDIKAKKDFCPDLVVFPELTIVGYPPLDLVQRSGFVEEQNKCLERILEFSKSYLSLNIALGVVTKNGHGQLFNSLVVVRQGEMILKVDKQCLPTYNIFDEQRIFTPGRADQVNILEIKGTNIGFFICEDLWSNEENKLYGGRDLIKETIAKIPKPLFKKKEELNLVVSINASPANIGKKLERYHTVARASEVNNVPILYVNQVGGNDDQVYDGGSAYYEGLNQRSLCSYFQEDCFCFGKNQSEDSFGGFTRVSLKSLGNTIYTLPPEDTYSYMCELIVTGIRDYVNKCGFNGVLVSISGGIDSALVATLATLALGSDKVECVTMPSDLSSRGSVVDSENLCSNLGVHMHKLPIAGIVKEHERAYEDSFGKPMSPLAKENLQAAIRGNLIMRRSNSTGSLVLIGSNKSEGSVGYFTMFGDSNGGLAPIGDLYKTEVFELARYLNHLKKNIGEEPLIPEEILTKEPSAELAEGQVDSNSLPPYPVLDAILKLFIEGDLMDQFEKNNLRSIVRDSGISHKEIEEVIQKIDRTEYKRRMLAPVIRVHKRSFGSGRVLPLAKGNRTYFDEWLFS